MVLSIRGVNDCHARVLNFFKAETLDNIDSTFIK